MAVADGGQWAARPAYSVLRPGPFISGTTGRVLQLGQRPVVGDAEDDMEADGRQGGAATQQEGHGSSKRAKTQGGGGGGGSIGLMDLLAAGLLKPGRNKLAVKDGNGEKHTATLTKDGMIIYLGKKYASPTAFSVAVKRQTASGRQGNDGWRSTLYEGTALEAIRKKYATQYSYNPEQDEDLLPVAQDGAEAEEQQPETDQWVQCDRCDTWRVVPDAEWPAVEANESESWACRDATWDLTTMPPYTPACA